MNTLLGESRRHLGDLIEACQRCAWHLHATAARVTWPLTAQELCERQMDLGLFEPLAVITAGHFNALHEQIPVLSAVTRAIAAYAKDTLGVEPADPRFADALAQLGVR